MPEPTPTKPNTPQRELTLGERRVCVSSNPSGHNIVDVIKQDAANLIDLCAKLSGDTNSGDAKRCFAIAMTEIESAAMWAAKGATAPK